jgi:hypothetical protein
VNPFDYKANFKALNVLVVSSGLSLSINSSATGQPAIYTARKTLKLLKAKAYANPNRQFAKMLGFKLDVILISCFYSGVQCTEKDFYEWYSFDYGNCFTFNYKHSSKIKPLRTSRTGRESGLSLELFTGFSGI